MYLLLPKNQRINLISGFNNTHIFKESKVIIFWDKNVDYHKKDKKQIYD